MYRVRRDDQATNCGDGGGVDTHFGLRIASIFIILVCATCGALFPVIAKRSKSINLPGYLFEYAYSFSRLSVPTTDHIQVRKVLRIWSNRTLNSLPPKEYVLTSPQFATGFIHLLSPAIDELSSPCLAAAWQDYVSD